MTTVVEAIDNILQKIEDGHFAFCRDADTDYCSYYEDGKGCFIGQIFIDADAPGKAKNLEKLSGGIDRLIEFLGVDYFHPMIIDENTNTPAMWAKLQSIHDQNTSVKDVKNELLALKQKITK